MCQGDALGKPEDFCSFSALIPLKRVSEMRQNMNACFPRAIGQEVNSYARVLMLAFLRLCTLCLGRFADVSVYVTCLCPRAYFSFMRRCTRVCMYAVFICYCVCFRICPCLWAVFVHVRVRTTD